MMKIQNRKFAVDETVVCAELGDESVLLNVMSGIYFGLNPIGTSIWNLLVQGLDELEIIERLLADYDVDEAKLVDDADAFFRSLVEHDLAHEVNPNTA